MNQGKTTRPVFFWLSGLVFVVILCVPALSQTTPAVPAAQPQPTPRPTTEKNFVANILKDQKGIWTAPFHLEQSDAKWIAPLGLSMAALIATDRHTSAELVENGDNHDRLTISKDISYGGSLYSTGGISALFYLGGRLTHDERAKETGLLAAEALINSTIVSQALKGASQRQRPQYDHSSGEFFDGGSSFPSGHAINSWTLATVIASEYGPRHPAVRYAAYGLATAISISRYTGRRHFLSDVLAGSAMGFGIGRYVYHQHHDTSLDEETGKQTSHLLKSKFFPAIAPAFSRQSHSYGAALAWNF
ncbi:MAG TPA: phosphatase PAP2 family protein [Pyrinomonadaceae bacterium]|jgi:membrane-associated phospholipid phosphatase|nr:phosphatase PAP2 family protein [Pyrinomonadaceae bacterium]